MIVLGIADSITGGATLLSDGQILAAVSEERLNRQKMAMGFPQRSIEEVLRIAGLDMSQVDHVAVATKDLFWMPESQKLDDYFRSSKGSLNRHLFLSSGSFFAKWTGGARLSRNVYYKMKGVLTRPRRQKIKEVLAQRWGYRGDVSFVDHHLAHCASAYFTSGLDEATVISLDGAGDGCSSHVYHVQDGTFRLMSTTDSYDSIGNYYAYVTHLCGFKAHRHEGKITGLAAYGDPSYLDLFRRYIAYDEGEIRNIGGCFDWSAISKIQQEIGQDFDKADLSASMQYILEEVVTQYTDYWVARTGCSHVALAGGVCANVKLNQRIHELDGVESVFIHPGMGDEGLATGAALIESFRLCQETRTAFQRGQIDDVYWGPEYSESEMGAAIRASGLPYQYDPDVEVQAARLLAQGKVIARFGGRMEYGPRALGNRSILYQPTDPTVQDWLNDRLERTEFMPFAPVTLAEYTNQCYNGVGGAEVPARFMTITFDCTDWMRRHCPAVVHVDGTARPQIIDRDANPGYYRIVDEYRKLTGLPTLINTSFNMHEEPIVCSPQDAVRSFQAGHLDYLVMDRFLVENPSLRKEAVARTLRRSQSQVPLTTSR